MDGFPDMNDLLVEFRLRSAVELMLRLPFRAEKYKYNFVLTNIVYFYFYFVSEFAQLLRKILLLKNCSFCFRNTSCSCWACRPGNYQFLYQSKQHVKSLKFILWYLVLMISSNKTDSNFSNFKNCLSLNKTL
jgi:hypothetical protein